MAAAFAWFLALRYLLTRWVNLWGIIGVAVAVWALILVISIFTGFIDQQRSNIRDASPDLLLTSLAKDSDYRQLQPLLQADPDVMSTAPRLMHYAILLPHQSAQLIKRSDPLVPPAYSTPYVQLLGVDPKAETKTTAFRSWLTDVAHARPSLRVPDPESLMVEDLENPFSVSPQVQERFRRGTGQPARGGPPLGSAEGLLLGYHRMAYGDELRPGQPIDLVSARFVEVKENGKTRQVLKKIKYSLRVAGAFHTKYQLVDDSMAMLDIWVLRSMLGHDLWDQDAAHLVSDVAIKLEPGADPQATARRLEKIVAEVSGGNVLTWDEQHATYLGAVNRERVLMKIVLFAVMLVAAFLIYATLYMMVTQKIKDIGILTSLGGTPSGIGAIFLLTGAAIAFSGCILGGVTGCLCSHYLNEILDFFGIQLFPQNLYSLYRIPQHLELDWILQVLGGAFILALLVAWLPARKAARMDPVLALMHN